MRKISHNRTWSTRGIYVQDIIVSQIILMFKLKASFTYVSFFSSFSMLFTIKNVLQNLKNYELFMSKIT